MIQVDVEEGGACAVKDVYAGRSHSPPKATSMAGIDADIDASKITCLVNYGAKIQPNLVVGAKGSHYSLADGRTLLDWSSGQMSSILGHGHPEIVQVISQYAASLDHTLSYGLDCVLFLNTGSESNEAAIKLAKVYTGKYEIVGLGESWHGMTSLAQGAQFQAGRRGHGPSLPGQFMLPQPNAYRSRFRFNDGSYDWKSELDYGWELIDQASCGSLAACLVECIQGDGGVHVLPPGYLQALKQHCELRDMLFIVDEAQTGLGRTGNLFAFEYHGIVPDFLTLSKTLGNGLPLSAVITSSKINTVCKERDFLFFTTHANDPLLAAVGDKVLEIVTRDELALNASKRGEELFTGLKQLQTRYECIGDVRGRGLMAGIEIVSERASKGPSLELAETLSSNMVRRGLWIQLQTLRTSTGVFRIGPPLNSTEEDIRTGLDILKEVFRTTPGTKPLKQELNIKTITNDM